MFKNEQDGQKKGQEQRCPPISPIFATPR